MRAPTETAARVIVNLKSFCIFHALTRFYALRKIKRRVRIRTSTVGTCTHWLFMYLRVMVENFVQSDHWKIGVGTRGSRQVENDVWKSRGNVRGKHRTFGKSNQKYRVQCNIFVCKIDLAILFGSHRVAGVFCYVSFFFDCQIVVGTLSRAIVFNFAAVSNTSGRLKESAASGRGRSVESFTFLRRLITPFLTG